MLFMDAEMSQEDKMLSLIQLVFVDLPEVCDISEAYDFIMWFYLCGKPAPAGKNEGLDNSGAAYDYDYDDGYIYAAFLSQYRINLRTAKLHWWEFRALFRSLEGDRRFSEITGFRTMEISLKMSAEMQSYYRKMKERYAIPVSEAEKAELDGLTEALLNGGDISRFL